MKPSFYYSDFRLKELCTPKYRHLLYLLYWPAFCLSFFLIRLFPTDYHVIHCAWDEWIPFCKWFIFPYVGWFLFVAWSVLYTAVHDVPLFIRLHRYYVLTGTLALLCFILYPSMETMRPASVPGHDPAALLVRLIYAADTPTNIFPSEHVVNAFGVVFAVFSCRRPAVGKPWFRFAVLFQAFVICASTLLVKQHSVLDVLAAAVPVFLGWLLCFRHRFP